MKEKVLCTDLFEQNKFREIKVTEVNIPKPERLIGGTEVYQKPGLPYWFCKIKNGRDEFMHLYVEDLTEKDVYGNSDILFFSTEKEADFVSNILEAIANKPKEGFRWLPVYEPSEDEGSEIKYVKGKKVLHNLTCPEWECLLKNYSIENDSAMCSEYTYMLLMLRYMKDGIATKEQLIENSTKIGKYANSEDISKVLDLTGTKEFGGMYGLIGNTRKILKSEKPEFQYCFAGGSIHHNGYNESAGEIVYTNYTRFLYPFCIGLVELKK